MADLLPTPKHTSIGPRPIKRRRLASYDLNIPSAPREPSMIQSPSQSKLQTLHDGLICHCCQRSLPTSPTCLGEWSQCARCQKSTCNVCSRTCTMTAPSKLLIEEPTLDATTSPRQTLKQLSRVLAGQKLTKTRRRPHDGHDGDDEELGGCHRQICRHCIGVDSEHHSTCVDCMTDSSWSTGVEGTT
ncbi:hypothetical protein CALCODRAFT_345436 [Calocera cornea HHB12733]|uniref:Uncharacterized protein n=1 Tax=Calocera cornea HHB12733 TaxID=1353952 RepID=A0A165EV12_9BASI|nr:hypothetical protein CALCODRAFT_345436 [Calocera cornea HHB12733]